jgi:hypothetical protein
MRSHAGVDVFPAALVTCGLQCLLASAASPHLQFLKELGLEEENPGVYCGKWAGSGELLTSYNPSTGKPIARVRQATAEEYEACLAAMESGRKAWAEVSPAPCVLAANLAALPLAYA